MANDLNQASLIGHLGSDPEMKFTSNGRPVAKFTVATNRSWKNDTGDEVKKTDWHNIEVWGKLAEICNQYLKKGRQVFIQGRMQTDQYEVEGQKKYFSKIVADTVQFLGGGSGNGNGLGTPQEEEFGGEEEIPF